jgi:hypothetical protein
VNVGGKKVGPNDWPLLTYDRDSPIGVLLALYLGPIDVIYMPDHDAGSVSVLHQFLTSFSPYG